MAERRRDRDGNEFELQSWACPTCGPGKTRVLGTRGGPSQRDARGIENTIVQCVHCELLFPDPFPIPIDAQRLYGDPTSYFAEHDLTLKVDNYRELVRAVKARSGRANPRLVDIGAGRGDFLRAATLEGLSDTLGLETSKAMVAFAAAHFGLELQPRTVEAFAAEKPAPFDVVVLNAVLEHVYDPRSFMAAVAAICKPGGLVYIDVPREPHLLAVAGNAWNRLRGRTTVFNLQPTWPPFHVYGFNPKAIGCLLERSGFVLETMQVYANPIVKPGPTLKSVVQARVATQINRLANLAGYASNMYLWARRLP